MITGLGICRESLGSYVNLPWGVVKGENISSGNHIILRNALAQQLQYCRGALIDMTVKDKEDMAILNKEREEKALAYKKRCKEYMKFFHKVQRQVRKKALKEGKQ